MQITSLGEYLSVVRNLRREWPQKERPERRGEEENLWFRGQQDAEWALTPKIYREEFRGTDENEVRQEFQTKALQLIHDRLPRDKWDWYFLMQHYRAPTRLLDWTDNPLMALFFAVSSDRVSNNKIKQAAVWVLDPWWLNRKLRQGIVGPMLPGWFEAERYLPDLEAAFEGKEVTPRLPAAIEPPHIDRRLAIQGSRFLIFGKNLELTKCAAVKKDRKRRLRKIMIPGKAVFGLREELENCGITESLVFPDLDALGRDLSRRWTRFS